MYPAAKSIDKPHVKAFMDFTMANADAIAKAAKIVPLTAEQTETAKEELAKAESGT